jgi:hypothetical protein
VNSSSPDDYGGRWRGVLVTAVLVVIALMLRCGLAGFVTRE